MASSLPSAERHFCRRSGRVAGLVMSGVGHDAENFWSWKAWCLWSSNCSNVGVWFQGVPEIYLVFPIRSCKAAGAAEVFGIVGGGHGRLKQCGAGEVNYSELFPGFFFGVDLAVFVAAGFFLGKNAWSRFTHHIKCFLKTKFLETVDISAFL